MRPYEMMVLFHPDVEDSKTLAEEVGEIVKGLGGEIGKIDHWGKRRLAYPIQKRQDGFYAVLNFGFNPAQVTELDRLMKLKNQVMRHVVIRRDEE